VPSAIDALSRNVRLRFEKDPKSVAASRPIARISTPSLGAYFHYDRAERFIDRLEMPRARAELEKAVALDSTFGLAHCRLAYVCWWLNDPAQERVQLDRAYALIDRVPERQRYHLRAQGAMADRDGLEASRSILLEMERFYPDDKEMLYDIGDYSSHLSEYPTAIEYLNRVVAMDPGFARALQHLARVYRDMGRPRPFLEWARRYAAVDSTWDSYQLLGDAQIMNGQLATGINTLGRGRELTPERENDFTVSIADACLYGGRAAVGLREWDRSLVTVKNQKMRSTLYHQRAAARIHQGGYREGLADLDRSIALARGEEAFVDEAMAEVDAANLCMVGMNDARRAFRYMERFTEYESLLTYRDTYFNYWTYWGGLFKLYLLGGNVDAADSLAKRKFAADKWYGPYVAAYLHAGRGECAQAAAAASRVLEWGPAAENLSLAYFLGRCQLEHGEIDEAIASLTRVGPLYSHLTLGTPFYAKSLLLLEEAYERKGEVGLAARCDSRLLELWREGDPELADHVTALRRLERLQSATVRAARP
jgi:tetratricopeptide (TPR) repeat protein